MTMDLEPNNKKCGYCQHIENRHFVVEENLYDDNKTYSCMGINRLEDGRELKCDCTEFKV